jgi:tRNA(Ile)-lysidine synthase
VQPWFDALAATIAEKNLLPAGCRVLVAVSGGCDSVTLLGALHRLSDARSWTLAVAHLNHQLRGDASNADQDLVSSLAARLGLPLFAESAHVQSLRQPGESLETAARRVRHAFLARVALQGGFDRVATGHHQDDQTELFLMRLLRGAGPSGLSGMGFINPSPADPRVLLVRPFLNVSRAEIRRAAARLGLSWREDASNAESAFLRNRVRHELIPLLTREFQPALARILRRTQTLLADQAEMVEAAARDWLEKRRPASFDELPVAAQREVLRQQLRALEVPWGFDLLEALRRVPDVPIQVRPNQRVIRERSGTVVLNPPVSAATEPFLWDELRLDLREDHGEASFAGLRLQWRRQPSIAADLRGSDGSGECFDADAIGPEMRLRHWRPGDRFQPIGMQSAAKLQDLFTNARVPASRRRRLVVAENAEGGLFWVEGLRIGEIARVRTGTTHCLWWRWERPHSHQPAA